jgi:membrane-bound lytic murein transglycosylase D
MKKLPLACLIPAMLFCLALCALLPVISGASASEGSEDALERDEVKRQVAKFTTKERAFLQSAFDNASLYIDIAEKALRQRELPEDLAYLPLIESGYSVKAYSRAGAAGLWQFMAGTARLYRMRVDYWVDERRDPFKSSEKAADHLKDLYEYFKSWELTLAAYNAGSRSVSRAVEKGKTRDYWKLCSMGLLKRETRDYVPRYYAAAAIARDPELYGFVFKRDGGFPEFAVIRADKTIDLTVLGAKSGVDLASLRLLNPELRRVITPYGEKYELRVPKAGFDRILAAYDELPKDVFGHLKRHEVKTGETLGEIAIRYGTDIQLLKKINDIGDAKRLRAGDRILVPVGDGFGTRPVGRSDRAETVQAGMESQEGARRAFGLQTVGYRVRQGDSVWSIARKFETEVEGVLAANGLSFESVIKPGDEIDLWLDLPIRP